MTEPLTAISISDKGFDPNASLIENLSGLRECGFTHLHFSHKWTHPEPIPPEELEIWLEALAQTGLKVLDSHGCHPQNTHFWSADSQSRKAAVQRMLHRLEVTSLLGGDCVVYHVPYHVEPSASVLNWFIDCLRELEEPARSLNLKISLENHYSLENDRRALDLAFSTFDADYIGFTFDPGHALISGNMLWLTKNCCQRLSCLHLNDNDSRKDKHWLPFHNRGVADWHEIAAFIANSPYQKPLQLEVYCSPDESQTHREFWTCGRHAATKLAHYISAHSKPGKDPLTQ